MDVSKGGNMNRLKKIRTDSNISLRKLSEYLEIPSSALSLIENGKQPLREIHVKKISNFFDVTSDYLLGYSTSGIGIYFESSEDGNDHEFICASELEKLRESYEVKEDIIHRPNSETWTMRTSVYEEVAFCCKYQVFRSVNIAKEKASISTSLRSQIFDKLNNYDTSQLEKVLTFLKNYIDN